ncbi:PREDICTED: uncharacterized protein LOC101295867 [Fragaria vesca subsp. vesca]
MTRAVSDGTVKGIQLCQGCLTLLHLFFADDALFFMKATLANVWQLDLIFKEYCTASRQLINDGKSSIFFTPNTPIQMSLMCELLGFLGVLNPGSYLGLPTVWGRSKKEALDYLFDRLKQKLDGWKQKSLSLAGKEILIKSVDLAIPAFPMSCFKLPMSICDEINSVMGNFWWGYTEKGNKIHWRSWDYISKPKLEGRMGIRDLHHFNMALLAKQCWQLVHDPNSVWAKILKARYFLNCDFFEAVKGHHASWSWRGLAYLRLEIYC